MKYKTLQLAAQHGVCVIWMNRPEVRNAFNETMVAELTQAFKAADADKSLRAVVLAGHGPAFCAGADLNWMKKMSGYSLRENHADAMALAAMMNTIYMMKKPTIARVHGPAFAGGMGLVAACDIAIAAQEAEFCLSEVKLGLTAATISPYVVAAMGERYARRYFLTAERFTAAEAFRIGLVHDLALMEELDAKINELLGHLLLASPAAVAASKELIRAVARAGIGLGIHGHGLDAQPLRGLDHPAGDFAAVGNEYFFEHHFPAKITGGIARCARQPCFWYG